MYQSPLDYLDHMKYFQYIMYVHGLVLPGVILKLPIRRAAHAILRNIVFELIQSVTLVHDLYHTGCF